MRLRTLPLSLAGICLGVFAAAGVCKLDFPTVLFLFLTTVGLQVLSNLANELGDTLSGTDNQERQGIHYSLQDGGLSIEEMKSFINATSLFCATCGTAMIYFSFGTLLSTGAIMFLLLGICAIWAARHYTLGKNPYGYRGLGDLFVFLFFGLATVLGGCYLCCHQLLAGSMLLPAAAIGCFSVGVLNVNNIRDMKTDAATRTTVAIKLGERGARTYQTVLLILGWVCMITYSIISGGSLLSYIYVLTAPLFIMHLRGVWNRKDRALDPMLPMLVLTSFLFSLLAGAGMLLS